MAQTHEDVAFIGPDELCEWLARSAACGSGMLANGDRQSPRASLSHLNGGSHRIDASDGEREPGPSTASARDAAPASYSGEATTASSTAKAVNEGLLPWTQGNNERADVSGGSRPMVHQEQRPRLLDGSTARNHSAKIVDGQEYRKEGSPFPTSSALIDDDFRFLNSPPRRSNSNAASSKETSKSAAETKAPFSGGLPSPVTRRPQIEPANEVARSPCSQSCQSTGSTSHLPDSCGPHPPLIVLDLRPLQAFLRLRIVGSINLALPSLVVRRMKRAATTNLSAAQQPHAPHQPSPLAHLMTYVTTPSGKRRFQNLLDSMTTSDTEIAEESQGAANAAVSTASNANASPMDLWRANVVIVCDSLDAGQSRQPSSTTTPQLPAGSPSLAKPASSEASEALSAAIRQFGPRRGNSGLRRGSVRFVNLPQKGYLEHPKFKDWIERGAEADEMRPTFPDETDASSEPAEQGVSKLSIQATPTPTPHWPRSPRQAPKSSPATSSTIVHPQTSSSAAALVRPGSQTPAPTPAPAPSMSVPTAAPAPAPKKFGRPSLARLDTSEKVKTVGNLGTQSTTQRKSATPRSPMAPAGTRSSPRRASTCSSPLSGRPSPSMSLQNVARLQSQMPPSPASFSEMSLPMAGGAAQPFMASRQSLQVPWTQAQADRELARRASVPAEDDAGEAPLASSDYPTHVGDDAVQRFSTYPASLPTAQAVTSFDVSTVIPSFLYLGPDITTEEEVKELEAKGVRRILNCAAELPDRGAAVPLDPVPEDESKLHFGNRFERYLKIPMWDNVEAKGVQEHIEQACAFLDDARLHDAPVYVHCRAGKSRSVSVVIAYLIHAHRWTLQHSYAYVAERRPDISPNIGFVSCLMAFEEMTLKRQGGQNIKQDSSQVASIKEKSGTSKDQQDNEDVTTARHSRRSMPAINSILAGGTMTSTSADSALPSADVRSANALTAAVRDAGQDEHVASPPEHDLPSGASTQFNTEHKGRDGRYRTFRGPAVDLEAKAAAKNGRIVNGNGSSGDVTVDSASDSAVCKGNGGSSTNAYAPWRRATMAGLGSLMERKSECGAHEDDDYIRGT